jgi:hypothetical protein
VSAYATTCETLGGEMKIDEYGRGYIGCDIKVNGDFDLKKSYCMGIETYESEYLVPDAYGRKDQYYATLTNLDPDEEVKVYIFADNNYIECLPTLNMQCHDSDEKETFYTYIYGETTYLGNLYNDSCVDEYHVKELACYNGNLRNKDFYCGNKCKDGRCLWHPIFAVFDKEKFTDEDVTGSIISNYTGELKYDIYLENSFDYYLVDEVNMYNGKYDFTIPKTELDFLTESREYRLFICDPGKECFSPKIIVSFQYNVFEDCSLYSGFKKIGCVIKRDFNKDLNFFKNLFS